MTDQLSKRSFMNLSLHAYHGLGCTLPLLLLVLVLVLVLLLGLLILVLVLVLLLLPHLQIVLFSTIALNLQSSTPSSTQLLVSAIDKFH